MYETFDHTADVGIRARAADLGTLFREAARGLFAVLLVRPESVRPRETVTLFLEGADLEELLHDWLAELLSRFDAEHWLPGDFDVEPTDTGLHAVVHGEPFDPARHALDTEIKAVTYHGLTVREDPEGWLAEVILDV